MGLDANAFLHGPLFSRDAPLDRTNAASRISAYVYGNVLVLAALIPIVTTPTYVGIAIVLGTALSTFVAHTFAESVGQSVRRGSRLSTAERRAELRDSVPILTSAVVPCVVLAIGWIGWIEPRTAQLLAELAVLVRIGGIAFVIGRLNGERPSTRLLMTAAALALIGATIVVIKVLLTH